jgi:hypothetical protein
MQVVGRNSAEAPLFRVVRVVGSDRSSRIV